MLYFPNCLNCSWWTDGVFHLLALLDYFLKHSVYFIGKQNPSQSWWDSKWSPSVSQRSGELRQETGNHSQFWREKPARLVIICLWNHLLIYGWKIRFSKFQFFIPPNPPSGLFRLNHAHLNDDGWGPNESLSLSSDMISNKDAIPVPNKVLVCSKAELQFFWNW